MRLSYFDRTFIKGVVVRWPSNWSAIRHIAKETQSITPPLPPRLYSRVDSLNLCPKSCCCLSWASLSRSVATQSNLLTLKGFPFFVREGRVGKREKESRGTCCTSCHKIFACQWPNRRRARIYRSDAKELAYRIACVYIHEDISKCLAFHSFIHALAFWRGLAWENRKRHETEDASHNSVRG